MSSTCRCWKFGLMSLFNLLNWVIQEILLDLRSLDTIKLSQTELSAKHAIKLYLVLIQFTLRVRICNLLKYCTFIIFWFQLDMFWILNAKYKYCTYIKYIRTVLDKENDTFAHLRANAFNSNYSQTLPYELSIFFLMYV